MRQLLAAAIAAALLLGGIAPLATTAAADQPVQVRPRAQSPLGSPAPMPFPQTTPPGGGYAAPAPPSISCDPYGRCWRSPGYGGYGGYGYQGYGARPPGWADDLPARARDPYRFDRPRSNVVCDDASRICYKQGRVDKSETRARYGERAADRADDLRDRRGTARLFVPERGVTCDVARRTCYDGKMPDYSLTRRYFGDNAAGALR
jgi:hypothetical protein